MKLIVDSFPPLPRAVLGWYLTPKLAVAAMGVPLLALVCLCKSI